MTSPFSPGRIASRAPAGDGGCEDGHSAPECFKNGEAERLVLRWQDEEIGEGVVLGDVGGGAADDDATGDALFGGQFLGGFSVGRGRRRRRARGLGV